MKKVWLIIPLLLALLLLVGGVTKKRGPGNRESGGGDAAMFALCSAGGQGVGYDPQSDTFEATCGNFAWSGKVGGTVVVGSGRVADFDTPATSGGNGYTIRCTGANAGVGQDGTVLNTTTDLALGGGTITAGSNTTVIQDSNVAYTVNALRGYILKILTGAAAGERYIVSNTATTITVGTAFGASAAAADTYSVFNPIAGVCYANGEVVKINFMADAMLAQEMTKDGGKIYFPKFSGKDHGIYVNTGCGRKGFGSGTTTPVFNNCPVLRGVNDNHYQRYVDMGVRNIQWVFDGKDEDLFRADGSGREGVYIVEDTGGFGSANHYYDPADGVDLGQGGQTWMMKVGGQGHFPNVCTPISTTDPRCDVTTATDIWDYGYSMAQDARSYSAGAYAGSADLEDPMIVCVTDQVAASPNQGVCENDPRILCTTAGDAQARTGVSTGGCDFGAGGDMGTCESLVDAIKDYVDTRTDREQSYLQMSQGIHIFPGTTYSSSTEAFHARIGSVPGAACGTSGDTVAIGLTAGQGGQGGDQWILPVGIFDTTSTPNIGWITPDFFSPQGGVRGGTWMPNQWYGRDVDLDTASDAASDCLSGGTVANTDDEAVCDGKTVVSSYFVQGAGFQDAIVAYGSVNGGNGASWFDGQTAQWQSFVRNVRLTKGKRGAVGDWSNLILQNILVDDNISAGLIVNSGFTSVSRFEYLTFRQNTSGLYTMALGAGRNGNYRHLSFEGNDAIQGQLYLGGGIGSDQIFEDVRCIGGDFPCVTMTNVQAASQIANITLRGIRGMGLPQTAYAGGHISQGVGLALIDVNQTSSAGATGRFRNISIEDARLETSVDSMCLIAFETDATAGSAINTDRVQFSIRDSSIDQVNGATGGKAICAGSHIAAGGFFLASADTGIQAERYIPMWTNISLDGVRIADQPYPVTTAAQAPVCTAATYQGTVVNIHDDTVARGTCLDTVPGTLTGGGAIRSLCKCDAAGAWVPL